MPAAPVLRESGCKGTHFPANYKIFKHFFYGKMKIFAFYYKMGAGESTYTLLYIIYADSEHLHFPKIHLVSHEALVTCPLGPRGGVIRASWECQEALVAKSLGSFVYSTQFVFSKKKNNPAL